MSESLSNKVRVLTELINQQQNENCELLLALTKLLEDKSRERDWKVITARRMILSALGTHHPHVDITNNLLTLTQDHKLENERHRKDRTKTPDHYSHYS